MKSASEASVNEGPALAVVSAAELAKIASGKADFGYYFPTHGNPTRFKLVRENAPEPVGWDEVTGEEVKSPITVDIGYPDGSVAIRKCPIATGPKAGCFVFGPLKTQIAPEDRRGEEFDGAELGRNQPLN